MRSYRGVEFTDEDFTGATFRRTYMRNVKIVGCPIEGLRVLSFAGDLDDVVVNGVDVTEFVTAELDRRHPERVQLRSVTSADDHRAMVFNEECEHRRYALRDLAVLEAR